MKIYGQEIEEIDNFWFIHINRPIYGTCIAINKKIIDSAVKNNKYLVLSCPGGEETLTPQSWIKRSKIFSKIFKFPDDPMIMYQGEIKKKN